MDKSIIMEFVDNVVSLYNTNRALNTSNTLQWAYEDAFKNSLSKLSRRLTVLETDAVLQSLRTIRNEAYNDYEENTESD